MYRPDKAREMTTPVLLQTAQSEYINGVKVKTYTDAEKPFLCSFATYGGTEIESNGAIVVENTAIITTWYDPAITSKCRIKRLTDNAIFEIMGTPENVETRNMFCVFKVRRIRGGA